MADASAGQDTLAQKRDKCMQFELTDLTGEQCNGAPECNPGDLHLLPGVQIVPQKGFQWFLFPNPTLSAPCKAQKGLLLSRVLL